MFFSKSCANANLYVKTEKKSKKIFSNKMESSLNNSSEVKFSPCNSSLLIINIDDFGWTASRDSAVCKLYENRRISSATVLINGYNAKEAIKQALSLGLPLGLHVNLTEGLPIRQDLEQNTLLKKELWQKNPLENETICEVFHGKWQFFELVKQGVIKKEHIFKEIQAQVLFLYFLSLLRLFL